MAPQINQKIAIPFTQEKEWGMIRRERRLLEGGLVSMDS